MDYQNLSVLARRMALTPKEYTLLRKWKSEGRFDIWSQLRPDDLGRYDATVAIPLFEQWLEHRRAQWKPGRLRAATRAPQPNHPAKTARRPLCCPCCGRAIEVELKLTLIPLDNPPDQN